MDKRKGDIPRASAVPLDEIILSGTSFAENRSLEYFERLRREDPVHFNETEIAGRYWSLTNYEDIKAVDTDHHNFSSEQGITLGFLLTSPFQRGPPTSSCL